MMKLFQLLKEIKLAINLKFHPQGFHLAWNQGLVAGQKVPHVHLTIIPRYKEEPFAGKSLDHWLDSPENRRREPVLEQQILDDLALFLED
jgi:histidine triad (HIT) family protein